MRLPFPGVGITTGSGETGLPAVTFCILFFFIPFLLLPPRVPLENATPRMTPAARPLAFSSSKAIVSVEYNLAPGENLLAIRSDLRRKCFSSRKRELDPDAAEDNANAALLIRALCTLCRAAAAAVALDEPDLEPETETEPEPEPETETEVAEAIGGKESAGSDAEAFILPSLRGALGGAFWLLPPTPRLGSFLLMAARTCW